MRCVTGVNVLVVNNDLPISRSPSLSDTPKRIPAS